MNKYDIVFVHDSTEIIQKKLNYIFDKIGKDNVSLGDILYRDEDGNINANWISIRCSKEDWEDIKFHLGLMVVYA